MVRTESLDFGPARYSTKKHAAVISKRAAPWRTRTRRKRIQRTQAEKKALAFNRKKRKAEYHHALQEAREVVKAQAVKLHETFGGHNLAYYEKELLQDTRLCKASRKVMPWNTYLHHQAAQKNDALPTGVARQKISKLSAEIAAEWKGMSTEEKHAATDHLVEEVNDLRQTKAVGTRHLPTVIFNDTHKTLTNMEKEIHNLHARTGVEVTLFAVRSKTADYLRPFVITTSERGGDFFHAALGRSISEVAIRMEAYHIAGLKGIVENFSKTLLTLKSKTAALILNFLKEVTGIDVPRMYYVNFPDKITARYRVVIDNWPLKKFCSPADLSTKNEVEVLMQAWMKGSAKFRRLSDDEWVQWHQDHVEALPEQSAVAAIGGRDLGEETEDEDIEGDDNDNNKSNHPRVTTSTRDTPTPPSSQFFHYYTADSETSTPTSSLETGHTTPSAGAAPPINFIPHTTKRKRPNVSDTEVSRKKVSPNPLVNTITFDNGTSGDSVITKPQRKPRSDKGVKRGPRQSKVG